MKHIWEKQLCAPHFPSGSNPFKTILRLSTSLFGPVLRGNAAHSPDLNADLLRGSYLPIQGTWLSSHPRSHSPRNVLAPAPRLVPVSSRVSLLLESLCWSLVATSIRMGQGWDKHPEPSTSPFSHFYLEVMPSPARCNAVRTHRHSRETLSFPIMCWNFKGNLYAAGTDHRLFTEGVSRRSP